MQIIAMNCSSPLVSVVIPTYNHAPMLRKALESLKSQTLNDWEAVVVNNFSTDDTIDVVNSFNDSRIRLVNYRNNGIIAASRNQGIQHARAELIAFLDSDDVWYPEKLEQCVTALTSTTDLVCHGEIWRKDGQVIARAKYGPLEKADYRMLLFGGNCLSTSAVVVRKQRLLEAGCFSEASDMVTAEDYDLWLKLARNGTRFAFIENMLGEYRLHDGNASKATMRSMMAELSVVDKHFSELEKIHLASKVAFRRRKAIIRIKAARSFLKEGAILDALEYLTKGFLDFPAIPFTIINILLNNRYKGVTSFKNLFGRFKFC